MKPKVSIIIPCYNSEKWIHQSLMSALAQTWENTEVIFVDNESTDNSVEIANRIYRENTHLKIARAENVFPNCWDEAKEVGFDVGKISKKGTIISPQAAKIGDVPILPDVENDARKPF